MKYTSLSHWNTGHNVQQNYHSVEEWQDYCIEDSSVVWSKLFKSVDGELIGEYPERLQQSPTAAVPSTLCKQLEIVSKRLEKEELWVLRDTVNLAIAALSSPCTAEKPAVAMPDENAWIIEKLSYHKFERNDLSIEGCLNYLESEWKEIQGRTTRQLVMQILELLATAPSSTSSEEVSTQDDWEAVGGDYDKSIHSNPSADAWADFFIKTFPRLQHKRDIIHAWFANAMMVMRDSIESPYITEQDAREIINHYKNSDFSKFALGIDEIYKYWLNCGGRALLDKLNGESK